MVDELEWQTRRDRINTKLKALKPGWKIIKYKEGLETCHLAHHAVEEYPTAKGPADYVLFVNGLLLGIIEAKDTEKSLTRTAKSAPQVTKPAKPIPLSELDKITVMAVIRKVFRNLNAISRDDLLKEVSMKIGYQRLSAKLTIFLKGEMRAAKLRGDHPVGGKSDHCRFDRHR